MGALSESEVLARAERARKMIESDVWVEAFATYRDRIMQEIEKADSGDEKTVMHLKRLLTAANAAKSHLESLMVDGKVALKTMEFQQKRRFRVF